MRCCARRQQTPASRELPRLLLSEANTVTGESVNVPCLAQLILPCPGKEQRDYSSLHERSASWFPTSDADLSTALQRSEAAGATKFLTTRRQDTLRPGVASGEAARSARRRARSACAGVPAEGYDNGCLLDTATDLQSLQAVKPCTLLTKRQPMQGCALVTRLEATMSLCAGSGAITVCWGLIGLLGFFWHTLCKEAQPRVVARS